MSDYTIGSFNIRHFNLESNENTKKDFEKLARIIDEEGFDVLAIQEALSPLAVKHLKNILGENRWDCRWEPSDNHDIHKEGYAFIWNSKRVRLVDNSEHENPWVYENVNIRSELKSNGCDKLIRPPFIGEFTPQGKMLGGPNLQFRLINTHIAYAKPSYIRPEIGEIDARRNELTVLSEEIYRRVSSSRGGMLVPYTFLLGDYNLCLTAAHDRIRDIIQIENGRYLRTVQKELTTLKRPETEAGPEDPDRENIYYRFGDINYYVSDYDHFSYDTVLDDKMTIRASRVDSLLKYCNNDVIEHRKTISDHVPIRLDITMR